MGFNKTVLAREGIVQKIEPVAIPGINYIIIIFFLIAIIKSLSWYFKTITIAVVNTKWYSVGIVERKKKHVSVMQYVG